MDENNDFFERVKAWCKGNNTTIKALMRDASNGEWGKDVYQGWRKVKTLPKADNVARLAAYMSVSCDWLVTGEEYGKADLSPSEHEIIRIYRRCDAATQMRIDAYFEGVERASALKTAENTFPDVNDAEIQSRFCAALFFVKIICLI